MNNIKFRIKLRAVEDKNGYKKGEIVTIINPIFKKDVGIAFNPIDNHFEIISACQFITRLNDMDIYEGDKVLVLGRNKIGLYETHVVKHKYGFSLNSNKTILNDDACIIAIKEVIGSIYE
jgi:hypothetical protein